MDFQRSVQQQELHSEIKRGVKMLEWHCRSIILQIDYRYNWCEYVEITEENKEIKNCHQLGEK
jgi:hypothetical protein